MSRNRPLKIPADLARAAYLLVIALTLAYLEVQIEGPNGWASALPTWRSTDPSLTWLVGGRPLTGYHVALVSLLLLLLHWPALFKAWNIVDEARVLHAFVVLAVIWDFLWFVLNPNYGMSRYGPDHVWWYKRWLLGLPLEYYLGAVMSVLLRLVPAFLRREESTAAVRECIVGLSVPLGGAALAATLRFLLESV